MTQPTPADKAIDRLLEAGSNRAVATDPMHARLWAALVAAAEGGKRFRPALVTATHEALGGDRPDAATSVGAAIEMLHTAFVIHDDVIDGDHIRRGRLNVNGTFTNEALAAGLAPRAAEELGRTAGILAGDLALATAISAVARCGAPPDVIHRLLDLFDHALHTTAAGELADVRLSLQPVAPALSECLAMAERKTSAYSFTLPLQAGAVLAGAGERVVSRLGEAGRLLGTAFQLLDDLIGVFGDPRQTGKSTTNDLRTRKQTPLLIHAGSTTEGAQALAYVGRDLTEGELSEARRLLTASGSRRFILELAHTHLADARWVLENVDAGSNLFPAVATCLPILLVDKEAVA